MIACFLAPIYILIVWYLLRWQLHWLSLCSSFFQKKSVRIVFIILYCFTFTTVLTSFILPNSPLQRGLKIISNSWLGILFYTVLVISITDFGTRWLRKKKNITYSNKFVVLTGIICNLLIFFISVYGTIHVGQVQTKEYYIKVEKKCDDFSNIKIVMASDLHLGYSIGSRQMQRMVEQINKQNPDIVCFAGDIFDNDYEAIQNPEEIISILKGIKSKYGVFACYGNHDYEEKIFAGFTFHSDRKIETSSEMNNFLERANIMLLSDESIYIANSFYLVGRKDYSVKKKTKLERKTPKELLKQLDQTKPIFIIDHQPRQYQELAAYGADIAMGGHTHNGQLIPGNFILKLMWYNSYGYKKINNMHTVVSSGVGIWGPNMRVGTNSEIAVIYVEFI